MSSLLLVVYVALSLFPLAAGAGLQQYLMGADSAARSTGGVVAFVVGGLCCLGYLAVLHAVRRRCAERGTNTLAFRSLSTGERIAVLAWPLAFVAGFALTLIASGQQ